MANKKISDYTEATEVAGADLIDVSVDAGGGSYVTRKVKKSNVKSETVNATATGTVDLDWAAEDNHTLTLTGNTTLTFSNDSNGQVIVLTVAQDGTGGYTLTFPATVKWAGGTAPTQSAGASEIDVYTIIRRNGNLYGSFLQNFS